MRETRLSLRQLAIAAGSSTKWIKNAEMLLGLSFPRTPNDAVGVGLIHELHSELDLPLSIARDIANRVLSTSGRTSVMPALASGSLRLFVDLNRYRSSFNARLSRALVLGGPKRRGRPRAASSDAIAAAVAHGVDLDLLRDSLRLTPAERLARLDANAAFVGALAESRARARRGERP
jgi:hypothetical protein